MSYQYCKFFHEMTSKLVKYFVDRFLAHFLESQKIEVYKKSIRDSIFYCQTTSHTNIFILHKMKFFPVIPASLVRKLHDYKYINILSIKYLNNSIGGWAPYSSIMGILRSSI